MKEKIWIGRENATDRQRQRYRETERKRKEERKIERKINEEIFGKFLQTLKKDQSI